MAKFIFFGVPSSYGMRKSHWPFWIQSFCKTVSPYSIYALLSRMKRLRIQCYAIYQKGDELLNENYRYGNYHSISFPSEQFFVKEQCHFR